MILTEFKKKVKAANRTWCVMWQDERAKEIRRTAIKFMEKEVIAKRTYEAALKWATEEANKKYFMGGKET